MTPNPTRPPTGPTAEIPGCPKHLTAEARAEWRRITKELAARGHLARVDRAALAVYCQTWARWIEAENKLAELGPVVKSPGGYPIQNPFLSVANRAIEQIHRYLSEFGMSPLSRMRLEGAKKTTKPSPGPQEQPSRLGGLKIVG